MFSIVVFSGRSIVKRYYNIPGTVFYVVLGFAGLACLLGLIQRLTS